MTILARKGAGVPKGAPMDLVTEFRRHAQDCRRMAALSRNKQEKNEWTRLGERWLRCAENLEREEAARDRTPRRTSRRSGRIMGSPQEAA